MLCQIFLKTKLPVLLASLRALLFLEKYYKTHQLRHHGMRTYHIPPLYKWDSHK